MEYILIFRKGNPRRFPPKDPDRYKSKFTKAERDEWFSQVWSVTGVRQTTNGYQRRTAAFPEQIPYRLIRMFSIIGDTVLDPFLGTGTTAKVALELDRRFIGYEQEGELANVIRLKLGRSADQVVFLKQAS